MSKSEAASHPFVLLSGGDDFLLEREVARLWQLLRASDPTLERAEVLGGAEGAGLAFSEASSPSLFGDVPLIVVDGVEQVDDSLQRTLLELAAEPESAPRAILVVRGGVKGRGFVDKLRKAGVVQLVLELPKGRGIDEFISKEFRSHKRKAPTADAVKALREAVGDDLRSLAAAISQLSVDLEEDPVTAAGVERYYEGMATVAPYVIADQAFAGQVTEALTSLRWAFERDPGVGPAVVANFVSAVRGMVAVSTAAAGLPDAEVARVAGVPPWKVRILKSQARSWSPKRLADATLLLTRADAALKGGQIDVKGAVEVLDPPQRQALLERTVVAVAELARG